MIISNQTVDLLRHYKKCFGDFKYENILLYKKEYIKPKSIN